MVTKHLSINDAGVNLWLEAVGNEGGQSAIEWCSTKHTGVFVAAVKTKAQWHDQFWQSLEEGAGK